MAHRFKAIVLLCAVGLGEVSSFQSVLTSPKFNRYRKHTRSVVGTTASTTRPPTSPSSSFLSAGGSKDPGDELFPKKGSSYVPHGVTEKEYAAMKKKEEKEQAKKNFGMWGPRFKQTGTPNGDWMVQPGLWSLGFQNNRNPAKVNGSGGTVIYPPSKVRLWLDFARRHAPAFLVLCASTQLLQIAALQTRAVMRARNTAFTLRTFLIPTAASSWRKLLLGSCGNWRLLATKLIAALFFACPMEIFVLENLNRRRLWSRRRSALTLVGLGVLILFAWDGILSAIATTAAKSV